MIAAEVLRIPLCWDYFLDMDCIPTPSAKSNGATPVDSLTAFRNDDRHVSVAVGEYTVGAHLHSGETNYWIEWDVSRVVSGYNDVIYRGTADGQVGELESLIPDRLHLSLPSGILLEAAIERYRTPKKPRKRKRA